MNLVMVGNLNVIVKEGRAGLNYACELDRTEGNN